MARVKRAYEEWDASKGYVFQPTGDADSHHNLVKFFWQMLKFYREVGEEG